MKYRFNSRKARGLYLFLDNFSNRLLSYIMRSEKLMPNFEPTEIALFSLLAIVMVLIIWVILRLRRIDRVRKEFLPSDTGRDLEQVLVDQNRSITQLSNDLNTLNDRLTDLTIINKSNFQKLGFVRFNPFEDAGANMSFSLSLLDGQDNGIIISSLHGREGTRIYAKTVDGGKSKFKLTEEELTAINHAQQKTSE